MPNHAINAIRERWLGASWIVELVSTGRCDGHPFHHIHLFITTLRTSPKALLRLMRQRWAIKTTRRWQLAVVPLNWSLAPSIRLPPS